MEISKEDRLGLEHLLCSHYFHLFDKEKAEFRPSGEFLTLLSLAVKASRKPECGYPEEFTTYLTQIFLMAEHQYRKSFTENPETANFFAATNSLEKDLISVVQQNNHFNPTVEGPEVCEAKSGPAELDNVGEN